MVVKRKTGEPLLKLQLPGHRAPVSGVVRGKGRIPYVVKSRRMLEPASNLPRVDGTHF